MYDRSHRGELCAGCCMHRATQPEHVTCGTISLSRGDMNSAPRCTEMLKSLRTQMRLYLNVESLVALNSTSVMEAEARN